MCITALVAGSVVGGLAQASAAKSAAKSQTQAANNQIELYKDVYDETSANFAPYREQGLNAYNALNYEMGLGEKPEGYGGFTETPGYQFRFQQGVDAIDASAASRGNLLSGATQQALTDYGQNVAANEYGQYWNRLAANANMGLSAAGNQAASGQNFAQNTGNAYANIGNAQAAGSIGVGNAIGGTMNNLSSIYMMNQLLGQ